MTPFARYLFTIFPTVGVLMGCGGTTHEGQDASVIVDSGTLPHDTGLLSDPGFVACGVSSCPVGGDGGEWCSFGLDPDASRYCVPTPHDDAGRNDFFLACDEAADCDPHVATACCWGTLGVFTWFGSSCARMDCQNYGPQGIPQLCKTDLDCPESGPCMPQPCASNAIGLCGVVLGPACL
jgi:hypothetical protein